MNKENNKTSHVRAKIHLNVKNIDEFIKCLCDGSTDFYDVEDFYRNRTVNARSYLGLLYAATEFDELFLVNLTRDGHFTSKIDKFRK